MAKDKKTTEAPAEKTPEKKATATKTRDWKYLVQKEVTVEEVTFWQLVKEVESTKEGIEFAKSIEAKDGEEFRVAVVKWQGKASVRTVQQTMWSK